MTEVPFYDKGSVRITRSLFEVQGGTQFPIRNISAVTTKTNTPDRKGPIFCIIIGVFLITAYGLGLLLIALGIYWWISQKSVYAIFLSTAGQNIQGYASSDLTEISEIQSALNAAIAQH
jgi:Family of unknown function (DUF6232)